MRLSKFTPSLCTVEGGVFGACTFIATCVSTPQPTRCLAQAFTTANRAAITAVVACGAATRPAPGKGQAEVRGGRHVFWLRVGVCVWWCPHWFALLVRCALHCLPAWFAALRLLSVVSALAGFIHLLVKGTLFWFVVCASRGHRFALGTGGLKQSLLVGGIGPVYSLPKYLEKVPSKARNIPLLGWAEKHQGISPIFWTLYWCFFFGGSPSWVSLRSTTFTLLGDRE